MCTARCVLSVSVRTLTVHTLHARIAFRECLCIIKTRRLSSSPPGSPAESEQDDEDPDLLPEGPVFQTLPPVFSGPKDLEEMQGFAENFVHRWLSQGRSVPGHLGHINFVTTCKWAGLGTMCSAMKYYQAALSKVAEVNMQISVYSFTDNDRVCTDLCSTFEPMHLFSDLYSYFPESLASKVLQKQAQMLQLYINAGLKGKEAKVLKDQCVELLKFFVEQLPLQDSFSDCWPTWGDVVTDGTPRTAPLYPELDIKDVWVDQISPSCVCWSHQGTRLGWLGKENVPVILWALGTRLRCPDLVILECVPSFDVGWLERLSGDKLSFYACTLKPEDVGVPTAGERLWATSAQGKLSFSTCPFAMDYQRAYLRRKVECTPSVFLVATEDEQRSYSKYVGASDGIQPHPRGKEYRPEDLLPAGAHCRLMQHRLMGSAIRSKQKHLFNVGFFFDIGRLVNFSKKHSATMPRQLTHSMLCAEKAQRLVTPNELVCSQGSCHNYIVF